MEAALIDQIDNSLIINDKNPIKENNETKIDKISVKQNELKIELYPNNKPLRDFKKENIKRCNFYRNIISFS